MKKTRFLWLISLLCLFSCTKGDDASAIPPGSCAIATPDNALLIDPAKTELTDVDAAQVSMLFMRREGTSVTRSAFGDKTVENTFPIAGENGETLAYVVNYEGGGYSIVSATKKYAPILAFSDEGRLSPQALEGNGIALWVAGVTADIADAKATLSEDSPEYADTRLQWREYEQPESVSAAAATMRDGNYWYLQLRSDMMGDIGYCTSDRSNYKAAAIRYYGVVSPGFFEQLFAELNETDRVLKIEYGQYDAPPSFIWGEGNVSREETKIMPLLKTYWHQYRPYNNEIELRDSGPLNGETRKPAGCVAIAVAQILNYHRYPSTLSCIPIDWTKTQEKFASLTNTEIPKLVRIVNEGVETENRDDGSGSTIKKAQAYLEDSGYSALIHSGSEVDWNMRGEIMQGRPVYVQGTNPNTGKGHAWVCDGYYASNSFDMILAYKISSTEKKDFPQNPYYEYLNKTKQSIWSSYLHMNWGWKEWWTIDEQDPSTLGGETYGWYRSVFNNQPGYGDDIRILQIFKK